LRAHLVWLGALVFGLIIQTTILATVFGDSWRPDFTRSLVIWLALTGLPHGGLWYASLAGLLLDLFSGAPLGLGVILRITTYSAFRPARSILAHSPIILLLGPVAVLIEAISLWFLKSLAFSNPVSGGQIFGTALTQGLAEIMVVPLVFLLMEAATGYRSEHGREA
jgi:cell shape-determining protein MreD